MELVKKSIHMNHIRGKIISQITLDDDVIVPDKLPDIGSKITQNGNLSIDTASGLTRQIHIEEVIPRTPIVSLELLEGYSNFLTIILLISVNVTTEVVVQLDVLCASCYPTSQHQKRKKFLH